MSLIKKKDRTTVLKEFGLLMSLVIVGIGGALLWKERPAAPYFLALGFLFGFLGILFPSVLSPIEVLWMKLAAFLSVWMTRLMVLIIFTVMITPLGLIMRLLGKDLLGLKLDPEADTYWTPMEEDGPGTRHFLPY